MYSYEKHRTSVTSSVWLRRQFLKDCEKYRPVHLKNRILFHIIYLLCPPWSLPNTASFLFSPLSYFSHAEMVLRRVWYRWPLWLVFLRLPLWIRPRSARGFCFTGWIVSLPAGINWVASMVMCWSWRVGAFYTKGVSATVTIQLKIRWMHRRPFRSHLRASLSHPQLFLDWWMKASYPSLIHWVSFFPASHISISLYRCCYATGVVCQITCTLEKDYGKTNQSTCPMMPSWT